MVLTTMCFLSRSVLQHKLVTCQNMHVCMPCFRRSEARALLGAGRQADALSHVSSQPHRRLWQLLAEAALERLDLQAAERAFVHQGDYAGVQFTRHLAQLGDTAKQQAEVRCVIRHSVACCLHSITASPLGLLGGRNQGRKGKLLFSSTLRCHTCCAGARVLSTCGRGRGSVQDYGPNRPSCGHAHAAGCGPAQGPGAPERCVGLLLGCALNQIAPLLHLHKQSLLRQ